MAWRDAAARGGNSAIREVGSRADYEAWYPVFGASGLVMPTWAPEYGGLGVTPETAAAMRAVLMPYNLRALNPLGLNNTAAALFAYGTDEQKLRFLGPIVRNEEKWCQLFSEPGAGSDLASLATKAVRDGDEWVVSGQKVWTTWARRRLRHPARAHRSEPAQEQGHHLLPDRHAPRRASTCGRCGTSAARSSSTRCSSTRPASPTSNGSATSTTAGASRARPCRASGRWWRERARGERPGRWLGRRSPAAGSRERGGSPTIRMVRQRLAALWSEERIRAWTNQRVASNLAAGQTPGPAASIGKVHQAALNQRVQAAAVDLLGARRDGVGRRRRQRPSSTATRTTTRCRSRWVACSGAAPTPSRAAPPR